MPRSNSPRAANRRHVLEVLRVVKDGVSRLQRTWSVSGTVYEGAGPRPRQADEYPENQKGDLAYLVVRLDDMISGLTILREQVYQQYVEVRDEKGSTR